MESKQKIKKDFKKDKIKSVYTPCQTTKSILLHITAIGKNLKQTLENTISKQISGKCIVEGYVKPDSVNVLTYSSGIIKGDKVLFEVVFNCEVCFPVSGMNLNCISVNITKAGITAQSTEDTPSPFILFVARDHFYDNDYFNSIGENQKFIARVISQRFELNDTYIGIIAELLPPYRSDVEKKDFKPRLVFEDDY
jgi:DNA-directed RNA polymerase subunit E'/Rpb7